MKGRKLIRCFVICLIVFLVIVFVWMQPKRIITHYVRMNNAELELIVRELIGSGQSGKCVKRNGWQATYYKDAGMVEFVVHAFGIVPSSVYQGFYYSVDDCLQGFQGTDAEFVPDGEGFLWKEENGDNQEYIEQITDHWYWFEMRF